MGEIKLFQICYEGELTAEVSHAMRRLGAEPNFDQSWFVWLSDERHAAPLVRWLRSHAGEDPRLLVACTQFTRSRDLDRKSTRLNSSHSQISYAVFCLKKNRPATCARDSCPAPAYRQILNLARPVYVPQAVPPSAAVAAHMPYALEQFYPPSLQPLWLT